MPDPASRWKPVLLVLLATAIAAAVRWLVNPIVGTGGVPFITFFPVVALAAWQGSWRMGVGALLFTYLVADLLFLPPIYSLTLLTGGAKAITDFVLYCANAGLLIFIAHSRFVAHERMKSEAALAAERGEMLRITLASIGDGVIATDADSRVTFFNPVAETLTGWSQREANGRSLAEVFHIINEQSRQPVENPCEKVLRTGKVIGLANHTVLISKDGSERPIDDSAAPILDAAGRVRGAVLVFTDATEKRRATTALQTLAAIVEHSDDAVISKNRQGIITSWNAAAERLYGYSAEEMIGKHISAIVPPDHQEELDAIMQRLWEGEHIDHWDTVRLRKDGSRVDVSLRISPIRDAHGDVIGASKVARDVTERKRAQAALAFLSETSVSLASLVDRESALQQAVETMVPFFADYCVVFLAGPEGSLEGYAAAHRDPQLGGTLRRLLKTYSIDSLPSSLTVQAWKTGEVQYVPEMSDARIDQLAVTDEHRELLHAVKPRSVISAPMKIREQSVGVISFVNTDESRRYTPQDVPLAEDLARRVAIAIDNSQLLASVKEADRQKDEFLAMLAHELRNPLAAIRYAVEAARYPSADATGEMLDMIERQVQNLARLIDDLLDISRISRDKIQLHREYIDAAVVARRAAGTVRPLIAEKHHSLHVDVSPQPMPMHADATRAEQIIANLLTNAAKYTPEGGQITLRAFPENGEVVIQVVDTGIGIAPDTLPFVFELFAQADQTLDRSQGGLGIGLTVVRKLAEMHGGSVTAFSEGVGKGAEFTVRLPLSAAPPAAAEEQNGAAGLTASLRVLVVDDNHDTARAEALLLKMQGHEVRVAHDGQAALDSAHAFQPHVILLDIGLPVLNGYEVASRLRQDGFMKGKLIAVSGYGQADDRDRSQRAGFDHHLVKPIELKSLLAILRDVRADETASDAVPFK